MIDEKACLSFEQSLAQKFSQYENRLVFVPHSSLNLAILALLTLSEDENQPPEVRQKCDEAAHKLVTSACKQIPSLYPLYECLKLDIGGV